MSEWINNAFFYHIYPLGALGAPQLNDFNACPVNRLSAIHSWLDHIQTLGANALYLGPLFESTAHGYDTANYHEVDRRLGIREDLRQLSRDIHERGMRLVLDGVFNHVGRDFWAFRDLQTYGAASIYREWFAGLRFDRQSPYDDPFTYEGWNGHHSLVKLNLEHWAVREHLFNAIRMWVDEFEIDGLRLDAADSLSFSFMEALSEFCHALKPGFWLMGEVIHGDYHQWVNQKILDSVTNYQLYKGLYSSHNDHNYFELAHTLRQQFGQGGTYRGMQLYNFLDNHDVNRIASQLSNSAHLYPLHLLLFTIPGIPSLYYGSEFGLEGMRSKWDDKALRPYFDLPTQQSFSTHRDLSHTIKDLAAIRSSSPALQAGDYQEILTAPQQLAFVRKTDNERILIIVNSCEEEKFLELTIPDKADASLQDLLNPETRYSLHNHRIGVTVPANWGRILKFTC